jgi:hypothetical protein
MIACRGGLRVYANADTAAMQPLIAAFRRTYPGVAVRYDDLDRAPSTTASSPRRGKA